MQVIARVCKPAHLARVRRTSPRPGQTDVLASVPCFGMELLERRLLYAAGDLDVSFDGDGWTSYSGIYRITDMLVEDGGRTVVVGNDDNYFDEIVLTRFRSDGSLDATFGNGGTVMTQVTEYRDFVHGIARQADGKYVVCGYTSSIDEGTRLMVLRYNGDGSLDTTFGDGGVARPAIGFMPRARDVVVGADGTITLAGIVSEQDLLLARLTPTGAVDTTFGNGGSITADFGYSEEVLDFTVRPDGSTIMLVRSADRTAGTSTAFVMRLTPDGTVDETFGAGGRAALHAAGGYEFTTLEQLVVLDDGRYLVGGRVHHGHNGFHLRDPRLAVARYNADGSADASFGDGGAVVVDTGDDRAIDHGQMAVRPDGSVVLAGFRRPQVGDDESWGTVAVALLDADGHAAAGFGNGGVLFSDLRSYNLPGRVSSTADGRIVLVGVTGYATFIVACFDGGPLTDPAGEAQPAESPFASPDRLFSLEGDDDRHSAFDIFSSTVPDLLDGDADDEDELIVAPS